MTYVTIAGLEKRSRRIPILGMHGPIVGMCACQHCMSRLILHEVQRVFLRCHLAEV